MIPAKIRLSPAELELVRQPDWILTKNRVLQKTRSLLEQVWQAQHEYLQTRPANLPAEIFTRPGKISRGENYKGLPYLVLDHPRFFGKENVFAIRTFFWWGNFFSTTLHCSGIFKTSFEKKAFQLYDRIAADGIYACIHAEEWEHHFENDNYRPVAAMQVSEWTSLVNEKPFIKLAQKFSLDDWEAMPQQLMESWRRLLGYTMI